MPKPAPAKPLWTCPFCPLLCDDIALDVAADARLSATNTTCPRLTNSLASINAGPASAQPKIDGTQTDIPTAISRAADILTKARRPLFSGLATDVAGARALYELAAHSGAILDHMHGDSLAAATLALQDRGALFTTLSEVRSRADLIVVFACEPSRRYPRFYERLQTAQREKKIVFVGCDVDTAVPHGETLLRNLDTFDTLALWSALVEDRKPHAFADAETARDLQALTDRIHTAHYTAFVYEPAVLPLPNAALAIEALHRIVKTLNRTTRAGVLALTGDDGALSVNQTVTWLSGFPLRTRATMGMPLDHDPYRYRTHTLLHTREADALLWVSSFGPEPMPDALADDVPAIILAHPATALVERSAPTVFIPVATPGVDSSGHLFRMDTSVVAPLVPARDMALPTVAAIASELAQSIRTRRT
ncbi:formylmethanofuran dehydrogenase [Caballeronia sp. GAWG1-5s-s]|uniref:formylmethanofuran dehydrogenase n=1 Tax=Caballeronia sp. GAWG1-5s-s TaxID=2921743 RepID=UPI0020293F3E|nr:formylmethanofuran dehydrogenase [Caballeronia sp. GAWG1-5s-s]